MAKLLYLDVETTGLEPLIHGIVQLAYIIEIDGRVRKRGSFKINPFSYNKLMRVNQKALEVNGFKDEDVTSFRNASSACDEFIEVLKRYIDITNSDDKFKLVAYNANFDASFVQQWFKDSKRNAYGLLIDYRHLDPFELFKYLVFSGKIEHTAKSFNLENACKTMEIEFDAHDAVADIEATRDLHLRLLEVLNG